METSTAGRPVGFCPAANPFTVGGTCARDVDHDGDHANSGDTWSDADIRRTEDEAGAVSPLARRAAHLRAIATVLECLDAAPEPPAVRIDSTVKLGLPDTYAAIRDVATAAETFCTTSHITVRDTIGADGRNAGRAYTAVEVTVAMDGEDVTLRTLLFSEHLRSEARRLFGAAADPEGIEAGAQA